MVNPQYSQQSTRNFSSAKPPTASSYVAESYRPRHRLQQSSPVEMLKTPPRIARLRKAETSLSIYKYTARLHCTISLFFSLCLRNRWAHQLPSFSLLGAVSLSWLPRRVSFFKSSSKVWEFQLSFSVSRGIWYRFSFWKGLIIDLVLWCRSLQEPGRRVLGGSGRWD